VLRSNVIVKIKNNVQFKSNFGLKRRRQISNACHPTTYFSIVLE